MPRFFYDLGSPYAWLSAERVDTVLDPPPAWVPVLLGGIFKATGRSSWGRSAAREEGMAEIERRARERGLPPVRWPDPWPNDGLHAMRVATAADAAGQGRAFALAAFRVHFTEGLALSDPANVALAAERAGLRVGDLDLDLEAAKGRLRAATDEALAAGVTGVPTLVLDDGRVFWGDDRLEAAAAAAAPAG